MPPYDTKEKFPDKTRSMGFSTKRPREFLSFLQSKTVHIYSSLNPVSVLATDIFKTVFEIECINYEISFNETIENINQDNQTNLFIDILPKKNLDGVFIGIGAKKLLRKKLLMEIKEKKIESGEKQQSDIGYRQDHDLQTNQIDQHVLTDKKDVTKQNLNKNNEEINRIQEQKASSDQNSYTGEAIEDQNNETAPDTLSDKLENNDITYKKHTSNGKEENDETPYNTDTLSDKVENNDIAHNTDTSSQDSNQNGTSNENKDFLGDKEENGETAHNMHTLDDREEKKDPNQKIQLPMNIATPPQDIYANLLYVTCDDLDCCCSDHIYSIQTAYYISKGVTSNSLKIIWPIMIYFSYRQIFQVQTKHCDRCNHISDQIDRFIKKDKSGAYEENEISADHEIDNLITDHERDNLITTKKRNNFITTKKRNNLITGEKRSNSITDEKRNNFGVNQEIVPFSSKGIKKKFSRGQKINSDSVDEEIDIEISSEIEDKDSLMVKKEVNIPFLLSDTLLMSLSNNISFLIEKKMFSKKRSEIKLYEFLAKSGISIQTAKESYKNLSEKQKKIIVDSFPKTEIFIKKYDNDVIVSGIEAYFLIVSYLCRQMPFLALQSIHNKKYTNLQKCLKEQILDLQSTDPSKKRAKIDLSPERSVYFTLMQTFKENIRNIKQLGYMKILSLGYHDLCFIKELHAIFHFFLNQMNSKSTFYILIDDFKENKRLIYGRRRHFTGKTIDQFGMAHLVSEKEFKYFMRKFLKIDK